MTNIPEPDVDDLWYDHDELGHTPQEEQHWCEFCSELVFQSADTLRHIEVER